MLSHSFVWKLFLYGIFCPGVSLAQTLEEGDNVYCCTCKPSGSCLNSSLSLIPDRGMWGEPGKCPTETFAKGMTLRIEPYQGGQDTALNAIALYCGRRGSRNYKDLHRIHSLEGPKGNWTKVEFCKDGEVAVGFDIRADDGEQLTFEEYSGNEDNAGATGLRLVCSGTENQVLESSGPYPWGIWTGSQLCPSGQGICGFRTQVDTDDSSGYSIGLNNAEMFCCGIPGEESRADIVCECKFSPNNSIPVPCQKRVDFAVVLDSSGSIGERDFKLAKDYVERLARAFEFASRFSLVVYSYSATTIIPLDNRWPWPLIYETIRKAPYEEGGTRTNDGIHAAITQFQSSRPDVPKKMVVITYGQSDLPEETRLAAIAARDAGIITYVVGVGTGVIEKELLDIAVGVSDNVFKASTFDVLLETIRPLSIRICEDYEIILSS